MFLQSEVDLLTEVSVCSATGYIGGAVFTGLRNTYPNVPTAALVRNPQNNAALTSAGARVVQGSHSDHDIIQKEAGEADLVVNCGDADDLELTKAVLRGIKQRKEKTGQISILVHTR